MDPRVTELHCIMPMDNVPSVMQHGILSYERAEKLQHRSVALQPVQERRDQKQIPGGLRLHQYANLYFHARNPMMFRRKGEAENLCVLRVSIDVLALPGVVVTDQNAATNWVRFLSPGQWQQLAFDDIFAADWRHPNDPGRYYQHRRRKCAEVLVPGCVESRFLRGAHVMNVQAEHRLHGLGFGLPININPVLFFGQANGA